MPLGKTLLYAQCLLFAVMLLGVIGQRFQFLPFKAAFGSFALSLLLAAIVGLAALMVLLLTLGPMDSEHRTLAGVALAMGLIPLVMVGTLVGSGFNVPRIHDITTSPDDNIVFEHAQSLRAPSENSLDLPSPEVLKLQTSFYDLQPLVTDLAPDEAFAKAITTAESMGWTITHKVPERAHIEAYQKTAVFGFIDDIAVRVREQDGGSVIDMRSVSRVGVSDLGANARRIERFFATYQGR